MQVGEADCVVSTTMSIAFYHALPDEGIWGRPPTGEEDERGVAWQLKKSLYGTRRAALLFPKYVIQAMVKIGFTVVRVAAQTVHGDDFIASRDTQSLDMFDEELELFFALKKMPRSGPPEFGGTSEGQFTKRTASWSEGFCGIS